MTISHMTKKKNGDDMECPCREDFRWSGTSSICHWKMCGSSASGRRISWFHDLDQILRISGEGIVHKSNIERPDPFENRCVVLDVGSASDTERECLAVAGEQECETI